VFVVVMKREPISQLLLSSYHFVFVSLSISSCNGACRGPGSVPGQCVGFVQDNVVLVLVFLLVL